MTRLLTAGFAALSATLVLVAAGPAATTAGKLTATDGPGFTISTSKKSVKHGAYTITVKDKSNIHNFHLIGPGVNKKTSVSFVGTKTWKVTLKKGTYKFICDPHKTIMHGTLKVT
jgi:plastocyanin